MKTQIVLFALLVLFISGCNHNLSSSSTQSQLPGTGQPLRISPAESDAAEPAIASSTDGNVYVVWVNHGQEGKADVLTARFNSAGEMQGTPVRVNAEQGIATAWRGDPPTIAVGADHTIFI